RALGMLEGGRQAGVVLVGVHIERIHDRLCPPTGLVGLDEVGDELGGGVRVLARARPVDPARRQRASDHVDRRRARLQRVVGARPPGAQVSVIRTAVKPARRSRSNLALAAARLSCWTASSAAPTTMNGPPAAARAGARAKKAKPARSAAATAQRRMAAKLATAM